MEGTGLVAQGDEVTSANQDAEFWSRLEPAICDMILEKLPDVERYELRVVCKEWYCTALRSMEHKPYLVSIVRREYEMEREYVGIHEFDADSKSLVVDIERLVPIRLGSTYRAVDGLVFCERPADEQEWCVYNIHTRAKHLVPPAPGSGVKFYEINGMMHMRPPALGSEVYISGMMVDTSVKPYTFKLVVSYRNGEETQIYDSASRLWSLHPNSKPHSNSSVPLPRNDSLFLTMCHKGSMYMSSHHLGGSIFVYSMEEDEWTIMSGVPTRALGRPFLGAWDDRIFAVVHEILDLRDGVAVGNIVVWEQVDGTQQKWVEYARCPKAQCEQILAHCTSFFNKSSDLVTVFCEEYVLTQSWYGWRANDLVLFNLKSREWESYKVEEDEDSVPDYYRDYHSFW